MMHPASGWRTDPYRFLIPLGYLFLVLGLGIWFADLPDTFRYSALGHALLLGNGFFACFSMGVILAEAPRSAGAPAASRAALAALAAGLSASGAAVLAGRIDLAFAAHAVSLAAYLAALSGLLGRGNGIAHPGPRAAVLGALFAFAGDALGLLGVTGMLPEGIVRHAISAGFQGFALAFAWACLRWALPAGGLPRLSDRVAVSMLAASLALECASGPDPADPRLRAAYALRCLWAIAYLRTPEGAAALQTGGYALCLRLGAVSVAIGSAIPALAPRFSVTGAHAAFLGGYAWMALTAATGTIVTRLDPRRRRGGLRLLVFAGAFLAAAVAARALAMDAGDARGFLLPLSASLALLPILVWAIVMFGRLAEGERA